MPLLLLPIDRRTFTTTWQLPLEGIYPVTLPLPLLSPSRLPSPPPVSSASLPSPQLVPSLGFIASSFFYLNYIFPPAITRLVKIDCRFVRFLGRFVVLMGRCLLSHGFLMASVLRSLFLSLRTVAWFAVVCVRAKFFFLY